MSRAPLHLALLATLALTTQSRAQPWVDLGPSLGLPSQLQGPSGPSLSAGITAADLDGDGRLELITSTPTLGLVVYTRVGATFQPTPDLLPNVLTTGGVFGHTLFDADGDGDLDLFVARDDKDRLYLYDAATSTFADASDTHLPRLLGWHASATAVDLDGDGDLDLLLARYIDRVDFPAHRCFANHVFTNDGRGVFTDTTPPTMAATRGCSFAIVAADYDDDLDLDLIVVNDFAQFTGRMELWENRGFTQAGALDLVEASAERGLVAPLYGMGAAFDDLDQDGHPELLLTNIGEPLLFTRAPDLTFRSTNTDKNLYARFAWDRLQATWTTRFLDLDGDGHLDMLIGQNVPKVRGDAFDHLSCLTAIALAGPRAGQILWQHGRPNPKNALLTNDVPFQIHDLDGDGKAEVVLVRDFQLQVWDGATGKLKQKSWMPEAAPDNKEIPYAINSGDSLAFFNLSGRGPRDILIKDRYRWFFVFDQDLKLRWRGEGQTGHYPYPYDFDNDGKQEFMIGYSLWDATGKPRWSLDKQMRDHSDAISIADLSADSKAGPRIYITGSDEGFVVLEPDGREVAHVRLGHAQTQSIGKYRPDLPGLQIMIANFWRSPGIVTLFDRDARILAQEELTPGSTHLEPVNWTGDGREFALLSANIREGGLIDGQLRRVVTFPDDGHPDLASQVLDLEGDPRDEILVWDQNSIWIYTQDAPFTGSRIYAPRRNPHHNGSNYRATVSMPGWK